MRVERDSLGEKTVPDDVYWGIETQRAIENFPISGLTYPPELARAIAAIKMAAAETNTELGTLDPRLGKYIIQAAKDVLDGHLDDSFRVDIFQAGAGTSLHMNANEVIANRALEIAGEQKGNYEKISPHDHVNASQSTNDVIPTALRIAALWLLDRRLYPASIALEEALKLKSREFEDVIKAGRTHLQDAMPIRLGQEFGAYASAIDSAQKDIKMAANNLNRISLGGTAVGTGINTPPGYREKVVTRLSDVTGLALRSADNLFEVTESAADFAFASSALKVLALELIRIANDIRLLSSGPRTGFGELKLPAVQPGSSIMPGKVNPSIPEMVDMVGFQVIGNDTTVAVAVQAGQLELNVMLPIIAYNLLQSITILSNAMTVFAEHCIKDIDVDRELSTHYAETSAALVTLLSPKIGYLPAAEVAKQSMDTGRTIREIVLDRGLIPPDELDEMLDLYKMTDR